MAQQVDDEKWFAKVYDVLSSRKKEINAIATVLHDARILHEDAELLLAWLLACSQGNRGINSDDGMKAVSEALMVGWIDGDRVRTNKNDRKETL